MKKVLVGTALTLFALAPAMGWADCDYHDKASMASSTPAKKTEVAQASATGKATNCSNADPKFVNITSDDFHLQSTSPAINKGLTSQVYDRFQALHGLDIRKDLESTTRPLGGAYDIGAYEFKQ